MPAAPVRFASTPGPAAAATSVFRSFAAATIASGPAAAVPTTTAVWPSAEICPLRAGGTTRPTAESAPSTAPTRASARRKAGSDTVSASEWTATWIA